MEVNLSEWCRTLAASRLKYLDRAMKGDALAQYCVAKSYLPAVGSKDDPNHACRNEEEADKWFEKASKQGLPDAQFFLGLSLLIRGDAVQGAALHRKAAESGHALSMYYFGQALERGDGVPKNEVSALMWLTLATVEQSTFRASVAILDLIQRDDVQSVSCPFDDFVIWRALVVKQLRRSEATGLPLQEAFALCGPNAVYWQGIEDWGGKVHIPMEGACGGDLFILPEWHNFFADKVREGGKLRWAVGGKRCHRVLLRGDHGEIGCATRKTYGDWTLYTSTAPYEPCNPFVDPEMDAIIAAGPVE